MGQPQSGTGTSFAQPGRTEAVLRFGSALQDFLCSRGYYDAVSCLREALERPDAVPALLRVRALLATAWQEIVILGMRGESVAIRSAGKLGDQALEMARELDDRRAVAEGLCLLSMVARCGHDQKRAILLAEEAVETARSVDDPWLVGLATLCLAVGTAWLSDDLGPADSTRSHELHLEALAHFLQAGDRLKASAVLAGLVNLETASGQLETARSRAEQAIAALEEMGAGATGLQLSLGIVLLLRGELGDAGSLFRTILPALRRRGDRDGVGWAIFGLACCAPAGDYRRAAQLHGAADAIFGEFLAVGGSRMSPAEQRLWDDDSARLRQVMGEVEFDDGYAIGARLTLEQAVDVALNRSKSDILLPR
jgi:hypothetical protein